MINIQPSAKPPKRNLAEKIGITVGGGLVVVVLAWALNLNGNSNDAPDASPQGTSSTTAPNPDSTPTPTQESIPLNGVPASEPTSFAPLPLTVDDATDQSRCEVPGWSGTFWKNGISSIAGTPYTTGFSCELIYRETFGTIDYLVPVGATRFGAVVGQPDDASNTTLVVRFQVINTSSGEVLALNDLAYGQSADLDVPLGDAIRITLRIDVISYIDVPRERRGAAGWAEPTFS
jgi:hypothetical protein